MRYSKKSYEKPLRPWDKTKIEYHKKIKKDYGLRRKKEILRAESILRSYRQHARELAAKKDKQKEEILLTKIRKLGLIGLDASLDDVLALTLENILNRRLQAIIVRKGLAKTPLQARQFIVHGHIALDGNRTRWPSTLISVDDEMKISFYHRSNVKETALKKLEKPAEAKKIDTVSVEPKTVEAKIETIEDVTGELNE